MFLSAVSKVSKVLAFAFKKTFLKKAACEAKLPGLCSATTRLQADEWFLRRTLVLCCHLSSKDVVIVITAKMMRDKAPKRVTFHLIRLSFGRIVIVNAHRRGSDVV